MISVDDYDYRNLYTQEANKTLEQVSELIGPYISRYVDKFYEVLLADSASAQFLNNELVEVRLKKQLALWVDETLSPKSEDEVHESLRGHMKIGQVHARVEIPMSLVDTGMTIIKTEIIKTILAARLPFDSQADIVTLVIRVLDSAMCLINESYLRGKVANERTSQEFITTSSAQELALEIERIKNSIYQWMTTNLIGDPESGAPFSVPMDQTEFGLWIKHKLPLIITSRDRLEKINDSFANSELHRANLLGADNSAQLGLLKDLKKDLQELIWHLTEESNSNLQKESKQDSLTSLLERKFLDPIMQQETQMSMNGRPPYSVIMLDLDHFKRINDLYGHQAGDTVLKQCCQIIKESIRLTDYAFRYGGEEVLILAPEMHLEDTALLAERIRRKIHDAEIRVSDTRCINVTASLGIATFSGHPDYQNLINEADSNLYAAKQAGRNCIRY